MEGVPDLSYNVTYQSDGKEMQNTTSVNRIELFNLSSGSLYNIAVITVGIQNLKSTVVHYSDFTRKLTFFASIAKKKKKTRQRIHMHICRK